MRIRLSWLLVGLLPLVSLVALAQGPPPAKVAVAGIAAGTLAPAKGFKGTVYFKEVSELATEVAGMVVEVLFEDGDHITQGTPMVRLDHGLLSAELASRQALHEQAQAELALEQSRLDRAKELLADEVTTPQEYDNLRFTVEASRHRVTAALADSHRIALEIEKKTIVAPFDGVVVHRQTEVGEWKDEGDTVAVFARDDVHDIVVNVPEQHLPWMVSGAPIEVTIFDRALRGEIVAGAPRGDSATRTFPIKVRVTEEDWLLEGMSAEVMLPVGEVQEALLVPRDAVLVVGQEKVLFTVDDGAARRHVVEILGYVDGGQAGIAPGALPAGAQVVVKGQERLREGQPVLVLRADEVASAS
jgi:RND family efflux transporter MFP subunit